MPTKKQRVASVLKRFQFIDLARAVAATGESRKKFLSDYMKRRDARYSTYEPFRKCISGIYGVEKGLDPSPRQTRVQLTEAVRRACNGLDEDMNLSAMEALVGLLEEVDYRAFDHPPRSLQLALDRRCFFRLGHYLVRADQAIFQFPYPRRTRLSDYEYSIMMALLGYAYVRDDFEGAMVEIADLSCETSTVRLEGRSVPAPRSPRLITQDSVASVDRAILQSEIEDVYRLLLIIGDEPGQ